MHLPDHRPRVSARSLRAGAGASASVLWPTLRLRVVSQGLATGESLPGRPVQSWGGRLRYRVEPETDEALHGCGRGKGSRQGLRFECLGPDVEGAAHKIHGPVAATSHIDVDHARVGLV